MIVTRSRKLSLVEAQEKALDDARKNFEAKLKNSSCPKAQIPQFTFLTVLGKGGYGIVYKARNESGELVAVKVQTKERLRLAVAGRVQALNEKIYLHGCDSIFIVKTFGTWRSGVHLALVLEYAQLGDLLMAAPFTEEQFLYYLAQIVCGIEYLHASNIIFGDLKPENCLIFEKGRLKLADFGAARYGLHQAQGGGGTLPFSAPEIVMNELYDEMIDWWACGVLAHDVLLRGFPFFGPGDTKASVVERFKQPDPLPLPRMEESSLSADTKNLIRTFLLKDLTMRLGKRPLGGEEVRNHRFFTSKLVDFSWVRSDDFIMPDLKLPRSREVDCAPDVLKNDDPEEADPGAAEFANY